MEWPKNLTETDKGSWFSQSSLLTLDPLPSSFTAGYVSQLKQEATRTYNLAGYTVQRERIEGLAVLSKIAVECLSLFVIMESYGD